MSSQWPSQCERTNVVHEVDIFNQKHPNLYGLTSSLKIQRLSMPYSDPQRDGYESHYALRKTLFRLQLKFSNFNKKKLERGHFVYEPCISDLSILFLYH